MSGNLEMDEALKALLVGTGLEVASNDGATIVLRRAAVPRRSDDDAGMADAGPPPSESIIVTGSRVISDAGNSPTPVTMVSAKQLRDTTPSNLADGLNKLPIFQGSQTIGRPGDGSQNFSSNTLNLRNFGVQRTLVLLDGHRATPSNSDGSVDIDTLPQMLVSRVDIVTGGACAVYGSDAVTGVVNFVLDKKFTGLKTDFNAGISTYGDAASYNLGVAGGSGSVRRPRPFRRLAGISPPRSRQPVRPALWSCRPTSARGSGHRHRRQSLHRHSQWPPAQFQLRRGCPGLRAGLSAGSRQQFACQRRAWPFQSRHRRARPMPTAIPPPAPAT